MSTIDPGRLRQLVQACRRGGEKLQKTIARYRPATVDAGTWERLVGEAGVGEGTPPESKKLHGQLLPRLALGLGEQAKMVARDAWAAAIVARAEGLWTEGPPPSARAVGDRLVWRALGLRGKVGQSPDAVRAHFLRQLLREPSSDGDAGRALRTLAAQIVGAPRGDSDALREALVRHWLVGKAGPASLADFAAAVRRAARGAHEGRFGDRQVFIASVWRQLGDGLSLDEFKARLVEAHRAGLLELVRADLVGVMDRAQVAESEAHLGETRYHFVVEESA